MQYSHARIVEALRARRADEACRAMRDELIETHEIVMERVIQEQGDYWALGGRKD
jgi:DNA-binding GntR family transcriptional regulator